MKTQDFNKLRETIVKRQHVARQSLDKSRAAREADLIATAASRAAETPSVTTARRQRDASASRIPCC